MTTILFVILLFVSGLSSLTVLPVVFSSSSTLRANPSRSTPQERAWAQEVSYSGEREIAWVLRWGLSRILRVRGLGEEKRGLLDFGMYEDWRGRERSESLARPN